MQILIIRPVLNPHWPPEKRIYEVQSHALSLLIKKAAARFGHRFYDLVQETASRQHYEQILSSMGFDLVIFLGHGNNYGKELLGHNCQPCIDLCNIHFTKNASCFFVCCHGAHGIGPAACAAGARYFWGYEREVYLVRHQAEWVVSDCVVSGLFALLQGASLDAAWQKSLSRYKQWIERIVQEQSDCEWMIAAGVLDWNLEQMTLYMPAIVRRGRSILPKITNPRIQHYTDEQLRKGIDAIKTSAEAEKLKGLPIPAGVPICGEGPDLNTVNIVGVLEERYKNRDWGHDDIPERVLVSYLESLGVVKSDDSEEEDKGKME